MCRFYQKVLSTSGKREKLRARSDARKFNLATKGARLVVTAENFTKATAHDQPSKIFRRAVSFIFLLLLPS